MPVVYAKHISQGLVTGAWTLAVWGHVSKYMLSHICHSCRIHTQWRFVGFIVKTETTITDTYTSHGWSVNCGYFVHTAVLYHAGLYSLFIYTSKLNL